MSRMSELSLTLETNDLSRVVRGRPSRDLRVALHSLKYDRRGLVNQLNKVYGHGDNAEIKTHLLNGEILDLSMVIDFLEDELSSRWEHGMAMRRAARGYSADDAYTLASRAHTPEQHQRRA